MDENMNRDFEFNNGENVGDNPKQEPEYTETPNAGPEQTQYEHKQEPVTPPTGKSQNYNPQYTYSNYSNQANQYMPYGSYNYANNKLETKRRCTIKS